MEVHMYARRFYRTRVSSRRLSRFRIVRYESDIEIFAESDLSLMALEVLYSLRKDLEVHAVRNGGFLESLSPQNAGPEAPEIVRSMADASAVWGVGPMAAVAGAVAERIGRALSRWSGTVIVENGGDIWARSSEPVCCSLYAGAGSPFTDRVAFMVDAPEGKGICTSSGTVGHSTSFGAADAVTVIGADCALADAAATAIANRIKGPADVEDQIRGLTLEGNLEGAIACCGDVMAARGVRLMGTGLGKEARDDLKKRDA
jgi:ApbE superfamily uncharacterized protein (UPF0280 family)